ncbi:MAG: hypothetical protein CMK59_03800, partial [Proteobacteria bacterium]|nr:hypothetical protein [Pseudomonadota bacterium]
MMHVSFLSFLLSACGDVENKNDDGNIDNEDTGEVKYYPPGCFIVDGGDGYALLNDAIEVADEGSTITMLGCDSSHEELVVIQKSISIEGPGADMMTLSGPVNETTITIEGASNVSISGLNIDTTRTGIEIIGSDNVTLSDLTFSTGAYGIKSDGSTLSIDNSSFSFLQFGGMELKNSTTTLSNLIFDQNISSGIFIDGGTTTASNLTVNNTLPTDMDIPEDGYGIIVDGGGDLVVQEATFDANLFAGLYVVRGNLTLNDALISNSALASIFSDPNSGSVTLENVNAVDNLNYG